MAEQGPWLSDEEMAAWRPLIELVLSLPQLLDRQLRAEAGISHAYLILLILLSEAPDRTLSMGELSRRGWVTPSRLTHAMGVFEARGWAARDSSTGDARVVQATLTDAGLAALGGYARGHVAQVRRLVFDRLDPDQVSQLAEIASALNQQPYQPKRTGRVE